METNLKFEYIEKYLKQKSKLPQDVRELVLRQEKNSEIKLYAFSDLDENLKFRGSWLVLTPDFLYLILEENREYKLKSKIKIAEIKSIKEVEAVSCTTLLFLASDDVKPLISVSYTHRQKIIMGHLKYVVEEKIEDGVYGNSSFDADTEYVNAILKPVTEAQNSFSKDKNSVLWRLLSYLLPYKKELTIGMIGAILTTIVSLVPAYISGYLIDSVIRPFQDGKLTSSEASEIAWILVASIALIYVLREFFIWIRLNKMSIMGEKVARDLRDELYRHLQTLSLDFYSKKQTGSIISRVSSDTDRIWDFVAFGVVEVSISIITLIGLSTVLISMDWKLGLFITLPVPFLLYSIFLHGERMKKMFLKAWRKWSNLTDVLSDTIPGMQVVKAFNQEQHETERFSQRNDIVTEEFFVIHESWTKFWPFLMLGIQMLILGVWVFAVPRLISPETSASHLTAGTFVSFLLYMTMFTQPIEIIGQMARMLNRATSSAYRIFEILDTNPTVTEKESAIKIEDLKGNVEFKNVAFSYDGVRKIIKSMNFSVKEGEMIGLVGPSGGGKTTITKLIARFYDSVDGEILIDGHNIKDIEIGSYRQQVGMVLQDPYLFHGTISENIGYGIENPTMMQIIEAAKISNAHEFILKLPYGYDTVVGERGHTLSGGERQRISIARAILHNPKILILDEATSAVDTETEFKIQEALDRLIEGRTVFAIAHRLSTLRKTNRIFVIEDGKIVERGNHLELLEIENGVYRKLHELQHQMHELFPV